MIRRKIESSDNNISDLVTQQYPKSAMAEAYRTLRTNLDFAAIDRPFRSILVTSANPQEGKSTITSNLAVVMAQAGHKVILVDCDLRKPTQHRIFNLKNFRGFTTCISQQLDIEDIATRVIDVNVNLSVLTSGPVPPNPAEILNSERTRVFWETLLEKYDYVLIDAPPILAVTDAAVLSNQVDGVLLVVNSGITRIDLGLQAKEQLGKANARLIGVVLNRVKVDSSHYYDYL